MPRPRTITTTQRNGRAPEDPAPGPRSVTETLQAATAHLLGRQHREGWWKAELATNVTMDAEDLLLREFLGIRTEQQTRETARWIRSQQRPDGTWATFHQGPGEISTTAEAWVALRLAGDAPDAPHMARAAEFVRASGGIAATRVFTRIWLALFGLWPWRELPSLPPEMIYLPSWFPLNIYDWGCWARQTVVPLTVVGTLRPVRALPFGIDELHAEAPARRMPRLPSMNWSSAFHALDRGLHLYDRMPLHPLRGTAMRQAAEWILARQEADGSWGGIQPPWVYSLLALHLLGYPLEHPAMRAGLRGLDGFTIREATAEGHLRRIEACQSPVWDTGLALSALLDAGPAAGIEPDHPALLTATDWLLGEEIRRRGDWAVRRPNLEPSGWAFEFANDNYPDTDDTSEIVLALRRIRHPDPSRVRAATNRAVRWLIGMQSRDGGWGAFDADNTRGLANQLPFCDFGEVIDPPSADVTAHIVEMLAAEGMADHSACRRGARWLLRAQEDDGSWFGRWGANYIYGTGAAVPALVAAGMSPASPEIRSAVGWLLDRQNPDGGWGEDLRSYSDSAHAGRGTSTPSQTAWALLALLAAEQSTERGATEALRRGVDWLCRAQRSDGGWDEPQFTGTGFPGDFYINYHLYRVVFPMWALGRYCSSHPDRSAPDRPEERS